MPSNPFKLPGSDLLRIGDAFLPGGRNSSQPAPPAKPKDTGLGQGGGGGRAKPKPISADQEKEDEEAKAERERANTPEPEKPADRTVVKITNMKWEGETLSIGSQAFLDMDVCIPDEHKHLTKITCSLEQETGPNAWKPLTATFAPCDAKEGKARCELTVPEPLQKPDGKPYDKVKYRLLAKHSYSEETKGPPAEAVPGSPSRFESVIYYSPVRKEYLCFDTEEEYKSFFPELDMMERLQKLSAQALESKEEKARKAAQKELEELTDKLFDKETVGDASGAVEELLLIRRNKKWGERGKGWVYIRPYAKKNKTEVKGHWRKDSDATLKKNLEDLLKKAPGSKEHSPLFETEFKAKLWDADPLKGHKFLWADRKEGSKGEHLTWTAEAAVCRLAGNFTPGEASINLKEKKVKIGIDGSASFSLLEGKASAEYNWPPAGVNLLEYLQQSEYLGGVLQKGRKCLMRLNISFGAAGFAGLTVAGAVNILDLDLSKEKPTAKKKGGRHASSGASGDAFAGARVDGDLSISPEWSSGEAASQFESLGGVGVEGGASAGIGATADLTISYQNGTFHFKCGAGLTAGLGCKGAFSFDLSVEEGYRFIGHLLHCVDYHFVVELKQEAFEIYKDYSFTLLTLGHKAFTAQKTVVTNIISSFGNWLDNLGEEAQNAKYAILDATSATGTLSIVPPEALGQALLTIMLTRENDDFRAIMGILNSTVRSSANPKTDPSATHKLKWTLRAVAGLNGNAKPSDAQKEQALKAGIKKIRDFGAGFGFKNADGRKAEENFDFLDRFNNFLQRYAIH